jgi:hypothetical protein
MDQGWTGNFWKLKLEICWRAMTKGLARVERKIASTPVISDEDGPRGGLSDRFVSQTDIRAPGAKQGLPR